MKYHFELEIDCDDLIEISNLLEHVKDCVEGDGWSGGYDYAYADYNWNLQENDEEDEECWGDDDEYEDEE